MRAGLFTLLIGVGLIGCTSLKEVAVTSDPSAAAVFIDGEQAGTTPTTVHLSSAKEKYIVTVKQDGFRDESNIVQIRTKSAGEVGENAACTTLCSPCCLGIPLLFLPFQLMSPDYYKVPVPDKLHFVLVPMTGCGVRLILIPSPFRSFPSSAAVYLDGAFRGTVSGSMLIPLEPGREHTLKVGEKEMKVRVKEKEWLNLEIAAD